MRYLRAFQRLCWALVEGARFYNSIRARGSLLPPRDFLQWRIGTVYGSFDESGKPRRVRALLKDAWRDRAQVVNFLLWRRSMRLAERRKR